MSFLEMCSASGILVLALFPNFFRIPFNDKEFGSVSGFLIS